MMNNLISRIRLWARQMKMNISALWLAYQDKRTPGYAKILPIIIVGYAFSPIDLIPDFIPVLGFVDDAIVLPALIWLAIRLIPSEIMEDCRERAQKLETDKEPKNYVVSAVIVLFWLAILSAAAVAIIKLLHRES
ncbi:YkvA family protein [Sporolactobacillus sp. CQH2019]|nr:YkvA family protein [Sporolactobacillus sp. CQH2019]